MTYNLGQKLLAQKRLFPTYDDTAFKSYCLKLVKDLLQRPHLKLLCFTQGKVPFKAYPDSGGLADEQRAY